MKSFRKCFLLFISSLLLLFCTACASNSELSDSTETSETVPTESVDITTPATEIPTETPGNIYDVQNSETTIDNWQTAYLEIICNMEEYLADPQNIRQPFSTTEWVYLGIHDFNNDGIPELIVGDGISAGVFTYLDNQVENIADLCYSDPSIPWCVNGIHFKDNCIRVECNGSGGSAYVSFGFIDGEYKLGIYNEWNPLSDVVINGQVSSLEEMNKIYELGEESEESRIHNIKMRNIDGEWFLSFDSIEDVKLDNNFNYNLILWD